MFNGLQLLSAKGFLNRTYTSLYDDSHNTFGDTSTWLEHADPSEILSRRKHIYGGFRDAIPFVSVDRQNIKINIFDVITKSKIPSAFVFLLRDPRDCVVSLYYSHLRLQKTQAETSLFIKGQDQAGHARIDDYVRSQMYHVANNFQGILALAAESNRRGFPTLCFAYEDALYSQSTMFRRICSLTGYSVTDEQWREVVRSSQDPKMCCSTPLDYLPISEDKSKHLRKATPGDYMEKLLPSTVRLLNANFSDILSYLALINPSYDYL